MKNIDEYKFEVNSDNDNDYNKRGEIFLNTTLSLSNYIKNEKKHIDYHLAVKINRVLLSHQRRIEYLENIISLRDTKSLSGILLKVSELRNTLKRFLFGESQFLFIEDRIRLEKGRLFLERLYNKSIKVGSIDQLQSVGRITCMDVSYTSSVDRVFGIQRVVIGLAEHSVELGVLPIIISGSKIYAYNHSTKSLVVLSPEKISHIIFPDASWNIKYLDKLIKVWKKYEIKIVFLIHDIMPLQYPELMVPYFRDVFGSWFRDCVLSSDSIICVSKSVFEELRGYLQLFYPNRSSQIKLGWSHSGANLISSDHAVDDIHDVEFLKKDSVMFLSVGTIEPRKGYPVLLDAFEKVWENAGSKKLIDKPILVIVGSYGWSADYISNRITSHKEYKKSLFWLDNCSDASLAFLYKNARALISSSVAEGFGLPIIEASLYSCPCIVSDIEVFKEISDVNTTFFKVLDPIDLSQKIEEACRQKKSFIKTEVLGWKKSTENLVAIVKNDTYPV